MSRFMILNMMAFAMLFTTRTNSVYAQGAKGQHHPAIHRAIYELKQGRQELKEAARDFGGHREKAMHAIDLALKQLHAIAPLSGPKGKPYQGHPIEFYKTFENHPHIRSSIAELNETIRALKEAKHDFGGHREKALKDSIYAKEQLELALKFDKN